MIQLVHENAERVKKILRDGEEISEFSKEVTKCFWDLAKKYPEDWIVWIDQQFCNQLNEKEIDKIFHHDLIMASFPVASQFLPDAIGYIDQLPFVKPNYTVKYPCWRMSTDVGGIKAKTALEFKPMLHEISNFGYLLNSMAKIGQQNGLFCYINPNILILNTSKDIRTYKASEDDLFKFVFQHYKTIWVFVLLFCLWKYESKFPGFALLKSFFNAKYFKKQIDLSNISIKSSSPFEKNISVDVIIPTIGRPKHLKQVLIDLKEQSHLPQKVIVVEQNPQPYSETELNFIALKDWPFKIVHHFTHKTGACMARNMALENCDSEYVFLCDDDNRFSKFTIRDFLVEMHNLGCEAINSVYPQPNEKIEFKNTKQWGAFGSGNSMIKWDDKTQGLRFDKALEYGYGEDTDFGLQLRAQGADIIYHPEIKITHLKAERGGFRTVTKLPWENEKLLPKPSPTMMVLIKKHYSEEMIRGYKVGLFLKYYSRQNIKNPFAYIKTMRKRWKVSEKWAKKLADLSIENN